MTKTPHASVSGRSRFPAALLFVFVGVVSFFSVHSTRTWTHLASGRWILEHGGIPRADPFSTAAAGKPWSPEDWLGDAVLSYAVQAFGERGLVALKALLIASAFTLAHGAAAEAPLSGAFALALAACAGWAGLSELPTFFDFPLLALMLRLLRPRRPFRFRHLAAAAALEALWVNLHPAGAAMGLVVAFFKVFKASLRPGRPDRGHWLALMLAVGAASLCHPLGPWTALRLWARGASAGSGWPAPRIFGAYGAFLAASAAVGWTCLQEEFFLTLSAATLLAVSVLWRDWAPCAMMAGAVLIAEAFGRFGGGAGARMSTLGRGALAIAMLVLALGYFGTITLARAGLKGFTSRQTAGGASAFLEARGIRGRMFNDLDSSDYLLWRGGPRRPVFVDRRDIHEPVLLADVAHWPERWPMLEGIFHFDYAVLENRADGYPCRALDEDPGWVLAYFDDASLIYVRRGADDEKAVGTGALDRIRPNRPLEPLSDQAFAGQKNAAETLRESDLAVAQAPEDLSPRLIRALALERSGNRSAAEAEIHAVWRKPFWKPELSALLGRVLEENGDARGALDGYRQAAESAQAAGEPRLASAIYVRIGNLDLRQGRLDGAVRSFRQASRLDSGNAEAEAALRSISP